MPTMICEVCGREKYLSPSVAARIAGRFCSKTCEGRGRTTNRVELSCPWCQKSFVKRRDHLRERNYCSKPCAASARSAVPSRWGKNRDRDAERSYQREYHAKNREKINALSAAWARQNRAARNRLQQLRRAGGEITQAEWDAVLVLHGGRCVHCGTTDRLERDHIVPVVRGGLTVATNLQPLCRTCNARKGAKHFHAQYGQEIEVVK